MLAITLALFLVASFGLFVAGTLIVKSLSTIAGFLRIQEFTAGFVIMAVATTLPELSVGITAALERNTALALGNVIGSNIVDLTLIAGIGIILLRGYKIKMRETKKDAWFMVGFALFPIILMVLGEQISRIDGVLLLAAFSWYILRIIKRRKAYSKVYELDVKPKQIVFNVLLFVASLVALVVSARYVVLKGLTLAGELGLPPILIGLFLIAFATSLPELIFETTALLKGHSEMSLGNLIGAVVSNSTLVLGVSALIFPISANFFLAITSGFFMVLVALVFATFVESNKLHWKAGISLIFLYIFFIILEFFIKGASPMF